MFLEVRAGLYWHKINSIYACYFGAKTRLAINYLSWRRIEFFSSFVLFFCLLDSKENIRIFNFKFSTPLWRVQLTLIWNKNKQNNLFLGFSLDVNLGRYIYNILNRNEAEVLLCFLVVSKFS